MRYLWIDKPDNPAWEKIAANGIDGCYFDARAGQLTKPYLEGVAARGQAVGIYIGAAWGELGSTPASYVAKAREWLDPLRKSNTFPRVQWDLEMHDPDFVLEVLRLWRLDYPWQSTSWTLEGHQGGWMSPAFVQRLLSYRVRVVPQYFMGDMTPWAPDRVMVDLLARGIPYTSISGCYDAARLHAWWDGFAFTQGRLP